MNKTVIAIITSLGMFLPGFASADSGQELRDAAAKGDLPRVEQLIRAGANVNDAGKSGGTPLIQAAKPSSKSAPSHRELTSRTSSMSNSVRV